MSDEDLSVESRRPRTRRILHNVEHPSATKRCRRSSPVTSNPSAEPDWTLDRDEGVTLGSWVYCTTVASAHDSIAVGTPVQVFQSSCESTKTISCEAVLLSLRYGGTSETENTEQMQLQMFARTETQHPREGSSAKSVAPVQTDAQNRPVVEVALTKLVQWVPVSRLIGAIQITGPLLLACPELKQPASTTFNSVLQFWCGRQFDWDTGSITTGFSGVKLEPPLVPAELQREPTLSAPPRLLPHTAADFALKAPACGDMVYIGAHVQDEQGRLLVVTRMYGDFNDVGRSLLVCRQYECVHEQSGMWYTLNVRKGGPVPADSDLGPTVIVKIKLAEVKRKIRLVPSMRRFPLAHCFPTSDNLPVYKVFTGSLHMTPARMLAFVFAGCPEDESSKRQDVDHLQQCVQQVSCHQTHTDCLTCEFKPLVTDRKLVHCAEHY